MTDQWFVYEHVDGWHVKRYSYLAYDDARMSDFVKRVHGTFPSRTEALEYIHKQNGSVVTACHAAVTVATGRTKPTSDTWHLLDIDGLALCAPNRYMLEDCKLREVELWTICTHCINRAYCLTIAVPTREAVCTST